MDPANEMRQLLGDAARRVTSVLCGYSAIDEKTNHLINAVHNILIVQQKMYVLALQLQAKSDAPPAAPAPAQSLTAPSAAPAPAPTTVPSSSDDEEEVEDDEDDEEEDDSGYGKGVVDKRGYDSDDILAMRDRHAKRRKH